MAGQAVRRESRVTPWTLFQHRHSAAVARERLQVLLSHDRSERLERDLLGVLRAEILGVVARHVTLDHDKIQVQIDRGGSISLLEIDIEIPHSSSGMAGGR
jgi:cell division topological specificity factor